MNMEDNEEEDFLKSEIRDCCSMFSEDEGKRIIEEKFLFFYEFGKKRRRRIQKEIDRITISINSENVDSSILSDLYFQRGNLYNTISQYKLASEDCEKSISLLNSSEEKQQEEDKLLLLNIEKSKVLVELSNAYSGMNKYKKGKEFAEEAVRKNKNSSDAYLGLGKSMECTESKISGGYSSEFFVGIENCQKAIEINPGNIKAFLRLSILQRKIGDIQNSNRTLEKTKRMLKEKKEYDYQYFGCKGVNYIHEKNYKKAIVAIMKSILIEYRRSIPYNNLANCYVHLFDFEKADKRYSIAILYDPSDDVLFCNRGICKFKIGSQEEKEKAIEDLRKGIDINPKSFPCHYNLASFLCNLERFEEAEIEIRKALKINPESSIAFESLAKMKLRRFEDLEGFCDVIKSHILRMKKSLILRDVDSWFYRDLVKEGTNENKFWKNICKEIVIPNFTKKINEEESKYDYFLYRGWGYKCLGLFEKCLDDFMKLESSVVVRGRMKYVTDGENNIFPNSESSSHHSASIRIEFYKQNGKKIVIDIIKLILFL